MWEELETMSASDSNLRLKLHLKHFCCFIFINIFILKLMCKELCFNVNRVAHFIYIYCIYSIILSSSLKPSCFILNVYYVQFICQEQKCDHGSEYGLYLPLCGWVTVCVCVRVCVLFYTCHLFYLFQ